MLENKDKSRSRHMLRLLKFIASGIKSGVVFETSGKMARLSYGQMSEGSKSMSVEAALVKLCCHQQLVSLELQRGITMVRLTDCGKAKLVRLLHPEDGFQEQQRPIREKIQLQDGIAEIHRINLAESPLAWLHHKGSSTGSIAITDAEFLAGERFRNDFEQSGLLTSVTSNWNMGAVGGRVKTPAGADASISDMAIDAGKRLNRAITALGPELSGVALDICCFLKRLEVVERERQWPRRSARLMLKTALCALARHYGYSVPTDAGPRPIRSANAAGYRPTLFS